MPARTRKPAQPVPRNKALKLSNMNPTQGPWLTIEVNQKALAENMKVFRGLVAPSTRLMAVVKANAYGHGLLLAAEAFVQGGADILGVHTVDEGCLLREGGITCTIIVLGPANEFEVMAAIENQLEITVASLAAVDQLPASSDPLNIHLKVETGVNRQGLVEDEFVQAMASLKDRPGLNLVGLSSHFADIEDTTDHTFARQQMFRFENYQARWRQHLATKPVVHMTCSAATLLWESSHGSIARVGISAYGIWPSRETRVSARRENRPEISLQPAMTWKCKVSQVRQVPAGETVGYGRSWKAMTDARVAVLPVGYSDGIPRALSGRGHVLLQGKRAPLIGRICMNLCMVDVTHIPEATAGDEAVLLGNQGPESITTEMLADQLGTIAYEVLTLPRATWTRVGV